MSNLIGRILKNRYRVDSFIGRGGMAEVYKVWDTQRTTTLAMKLLHEDLAIDRVFMRRFQREAQNLAKLQHPNIVRFYGLEQDGLFAFMLLDYIDGKTLKRLIFDAGGPMPGDQVRTIMRSVCSALQFAHMQGIIHCDIKPGNVMQHQYGSILLADFGIARMRDEATATMVGFGTPAYMAPEQVTGQAPTPQTDIYALGVVLFEMLTGGERPFTGEQAAITGSTSEKIRWEHQHLEPPSPRRWNPDIPTEMENVVLKCLSKEPQDRYPSAIDLSNALLKAYGDIAPEVDALPVPEKPQADFEDVGEKDDGVPAETRSLNRQRLIPWLLMGGIAIIAALAWLIIPSNDPAEIDLQAVEVIVNQTQTALTAASWHDRTVTPTLKPTGSKTPTPTDILTLTPTKTPSQTISPTPALGIGSTQISPMDGMVMVYVPAGEFTMGSEDGNEDEKPAHIVFLDSYWMDETEVTNAMYAAFINDQSNQSQGGVPWLDSGDDDVQIEQRGGLWQPISGYEDHPVVEVSWYGAQAYCQWAGRRLPTEAEWEKAARGTDGRTYPWGEEFDCGKGNFDDETIIDDYVVPGGAGCDGYDRTAPVGSFPNGASPYGVLDLTGNVWEWTADWYADNYYKISPRNNPLGPDSGEDRCLRGGSWANKISLVRVTNRRIFNPGNSAIHLIGFRCTSDSSP